MLNFSTNGTDETDSPLLITPHPDDPNLFDVSLNFAVDHDELESSEVLFVCEVKLGEGMGGTAKAEDVDRLLWRTESALYYPGGEGGGGGGSSEEESGDNH